jgi:hypothetical protein
MVIDARAELTGRNKNSIVNAVTSVRRRNLELRRDLNSPNAAIGNQRNVSIRNDDGKNSAIQPSATKRTGLNPENGPVLFLTSLEVRLK